MKVRTEISHQLLSLQKYGQGPNKRLNRKKKIMSFHSDFLHFLKNKTKKNQSSTLIKKIITIFKKSGSHLWNCTALYFLDNLLEYNFKSYPEAMRVLSFIGKKVKNREKLTLPRMETET